jgi:hypothetical protein
MWMLIARSPRPDASYWRGRRVCAAIDAVIWPALLALGALKVGGVAGAVIAGFAGVATLRRLWRAIFENHRYRFTTLRWGGVVVVLGLLGAAVRLLLVQ